MGLVAAKKPEDFEQLVDLCIDTFRITYNDTTALDANGVIGKLRAMVLDDERYKRETKRLLAKRRIDELREINDLISEVSEAGEGDEEDEEAIPEEEPEVEEVEPEFEFPEIPSAEEMLAEEEKLLPPLEYDARMPEKEKEKIENNRRKALERKQREREKLVKEREKEKEKIIALRRKEKEEREKEREREEGKKEKPRKLFDKSKIDMRLKLLQQRREIFNEEQSGEDKESDALNIFFFSVTREEFEQLKTVEVSAGTSVASGAFKDDDESDAAKAMGKKKREDRDIKIDGGSAFHYETIDGEEFMVED